MTYQSDEPLLSDGPFGNPDAVSADIKRSIDMRSVAPNLGIITNKLCTNIIIGRKGSGKTHHWRTLQIAAEDKSDIISFVDSGVLREDIIKDLSLSLDVQKPHIGWQVIWNRAVLSFLASIFYSHRKLYKFEIYNSLELAVEPKFFLRHFSSIYTPPIVEVTPVQYVEKFSRMTKVALERFLKDPLWTELENIIARSIPETSPIYIFIDGIDNQNETFPQIWYDCQHGLILAIMQFNKHQFGTRLHIVTTVRDSIYRAILRTEHGTRMVNDSHWKVLDWGRRANEFFLESKIRQLPNNVFDAKVRSSKDKTIQSWLGFDTLETPKRGSNEEVMQYILRHTRCLPRDIVIVGNAIHRQKEICRSLGSKFSAGYLRKAIEGSARLFARESVEICVTDLLITKKSIAEYSTLFGLDDLDIEAIKTTLREYIRSFVCSIGTEVFTRQKLEHVLSSNPINNFVLKNPDSVHRIDNVLWRNGLIAYRSNRKTEKEKWIFNWYTLTEDDLLPRTTEIFGFHPSFIDLYGIENGGDQIVF